jgi:hypothetical protein
MVDWLNNHYKKVILKKWKREVVYHQRLLFDLATELHALKYYDEEIWMKIFDTTMNKSKISNTHDFNLILNIMHEINDDKLGNAPHLKGKVQPFIDTFVQKHYTEDRKWRYDVDNKRWRTLPELIARREESKQTDYKLVKADVDERLIIAAREAEKKLKRLRMAQYSQELFDEIVGEMMRDKKTMMEMMAELDCSEEDLYAAQTRIARHV